MIVYTILLFFGLTGCRDFLEEVSQDEVKPSQVTDLEQILLGEAYLNENANIYSLTDIFTDDVQCNGIQDVAVLEEFESKQFMFTWDRNMFAEAGGGNDLRFWSVPYKGVRACNVVLDYLDRVSGDESLRESVRGEALVLRSWYYMMLVNFFGQPYNAGDAEKNLGVPLKLNSDVTDELFPRNTVAEVYAQVEQDLLEGNRLLSLYDTKTSYFRVGHLAAKAILSRMYLYMEDWDKALLYADSVLQANSKLLDFNTRLSTAVTTHVYSAVTPDEIIWTRKYAGIRPTGVVAMGKYPYSLSTEISTLYDVKSADYQSKKCKDLRALYYLRWEMDVTAMLTTGEMYYPLLVAKDRDYGAYHGIRTAELYLNRAEAYVRKYLETNTEDFRVKALEDLNHLRRHRLNATYGFVEADYKGEELLTFCLEERRRELCGETNHRWCDLRRNGMPEFVHNFFRYLGEVPREFTMRQSFYALPIPEETLRLNPSLQQNL